jgi:hypothetical protein
VDRQPIVWPQDAVVQELLFCDPRHNGHPGAVKLVVAQIIIQGKLHHVAGVEQRDGPMRCRDVNPARGRCTVKQIVLRPKFDGVALGHGCLRSAGLSAA